MIYKLGYIFAWLILGPLVVIVLTILCPFILVGGLILAAKNGWPKVEPKITNYNLTLPPKEVIVQN